jgi:hypothetical protein
MEKPNNAETNSKIRTPAYATFESNTDKLVHLFAITRRGTEHFVDEMKNSIDPEITALCTNLTSLRSRSPNDTNREQLNKEESEIALERGKIVEKIKNVFIQPAHQFTEGLLTINQWLPVILVTIVEAYLKEVRIFEAKINPAVMDSSDQSVTYRDVVRAESIGDLTAEMQSKWARNFVDDGGPSRWIEKLTRMGARGYDSQTADKMETLWGVRHVIVHSAGVVTWDFVRHHPNFGVQVGANIRISFNQVLEWIRLVYDFVDVTDSYFAQRYVSALRTTETDDVRT